MCEQEKFGLGQPARSAIIGHAEQGAEIFNIGWFFGEHQKKIRTVLDVFANLILPSIPRRIDQPEFPVNLS
jgi:hypothetical protein